VPHVLRASWYLLADLLTALLAALVRRCWYLVVALCSASTTSGLQTSSSSRAPHGYALVPLFTKAPNHEDWWKLEPRRRRDCGCAFCRK
jgi:hypothetical protein